MFTVINALINCGTDLSIRTTTHPTLASAQAYADHIVLVCLSAPVSAGLTIEGPDRREVRDWCPAEGWTERGR